MVTSKNTENFNVYSLKGYVNINTLSPDGNVYYQISKPIEINMGNWVCKIRFMNRQDEVLYFQKDRYAHSLFSDRFEVVKWSKSGLSALIYEYKRNEIYDLVLFDFKNLSIHRLPLDGHEKLMLDIVNREAFIKNRIVTLFKENGSQREPLQVQSGKKESVKHLIFNRKWMP